MSEIRSDIRKGDRFEFVGIGDAPQGTDREVLVLGLLPDGTLQCMLTISFTDPTSNEKQADTRPFNIPYPTAVFLAEQLIWRER